MSARIRGTTRETNRIAEVDSLGHVAEEPDLDDTREHLDSREQLPMMSSAAKRARVCDEHLQ